MEVKINQPLLVVSFFSLVFFNYAESACVPRNASKQVYNTDQAEKSKSPFLSWRQPFMESRPSNLGPASSPNSPSPSPPRTVSFSLTRPALAPSPKSPSPSPPPPPKSPSPPPPTKSASAPSPNSASPPPPPKSPSPPPPPKSPSPPPPPKSASAPSPSKSSSAPSPPKSASAPSPNSASPPPPPKSASPPPPKPASPPPPKPASAPSPNSASAPPPKSASPPPPKSASSAPSPGSASAPQAKSASSPAPAAKSMSASSPSPTPKSASAPAQPPKSGSSPSSESMAGGVYSTDGSLFDGGIMGRGPGILAKIKPFLDNSMPKINAALTKICKETDYSDLCVSTLSPFFNGQNDPASMINIAIKACSQHAEQSLETAQKILNSSSISSTIASKLSDCKDNYEDALDNLQAASDAIATHDLGRVNSMLSAVITDASDCQDSFPGNTSPMPDYDLKLRQMASNCLAITAAATSI